MGLMGNLQIIDHPLVRHHLTRLRDITTAPPEFRAIVHRLSGLLTFAATADLPLAAVPVKTPLAVADGHELAGRVGIVPILRAGLGMVDPVLDVLPTAVVWHLGFYRDVRTLQPVEYYKKLPSADPVDVAIIVDPMLATGGSAVAAIDALLEWGVERIKLAAILAAPEGVQAVQRHCPDVQMFVCAVDERLNDHGYILPGLGDAGDRICNTNLDVR
jgi:uracil phosphoribosyltransferase